MTTPLRALEDALSREADGLLTCVHCGFCLPACPTYRRLGDEADSPRGRLHLMRAVAERRLDPESDAFQLHLDRCLGCRACEPVCPSGVPYGDLLEEARSVAREARPPHPLARLLPALLARPALRRAVLALGRLLRATGLPALVARRGGAPEVVTWGMAMLAASAPAGARMRGPGLGGAPRRATVRPGEPDSPTARTSALVGGLRGAEPPRDAGPPPPARRGHPSVVNLDGCVQEGLFDRVNQATRHALAVNGIDVRRWPGQRCCGALHAHAGDLENARALARVNIAAFEASGADTVCVNAAGCGAALQGYAALLRDDPAWADRARDFGDRVQDVSEVLAGVGPRPGGPIETRVAYDPPCHLLHAQGVDEPVRRLLGAVPGLEVVEVPRGEECCGGAGIYGLTHPRLGGRIGGDKIDAVAGTGAPFVATGNPGCMMQIGAGLLRREISCAVVHPVELLAESYRRAGLGPAPTGPGPGSAPPAPVPPSHPSRQESHGR